MDSLVSKYKIAFKGTLGWDKLAEEMSYFGVTNFDRFQPLTDGVE
jgi:hypothetical protein